VVQKLERKPFVTLKLPLKNFSKVNLNFLDLRKRRIKILRFIFLRTIKVIG